MSDLEQLAADLGAAAARIEPLASLVVRKTAFAIEATGKENAPVDTGHLKGGISTDIDGDGLGAEIGPTASYGHYVEYGTRRMAPQPYMGPAADRHEPGFAEAMLKIADPLGS